MLGEEVFLLDAVRTPFGKLRGGLSHVRTDDLAAWPLRELLARHTDLDPARIEDVYYGNTNGAGEENRNVARMAALLAGLPVTVPGAITIAPMITATARSRTLPLFMKSRNSLSIGGDSLRYFIDDTVLPPLRHPRYSAGRGATLLALTAHNA